MKTKFILKTKRTSKEVGANEINALLSYCYLNSKHYKLVYYETDDVPIYMLHYTDYEDIFLLHRIIRQYHGCSVSLQDALEDSLNDFNRFFINE